MSYPRPQMRRKSYQSLDGEWLINGEPGIVPSCRTEERLTYEKQFSFKKENDRALLHFGAVDQVCEVFLNGKRLGEHKGGYLPFFFEITDAVEENNCLIVNVTDTLDHKYPWGKQKKNRGGMWYTPVSGIWGTVWIEQLPEEYISSVKIDPDLTGVDICMTITENNGSFTKKERIDVKDPELWTPEHPHLYTRTLSYGRDEVEIYFGLRTVEISAAGGRNRILLNGKPVFLHGVLDQGYFEPGLFIPQDEDGYEKDIMRMKSLGFNTLRKHIKLEPEEFYYAADRCGMLVIQDMVNSGDYSFMRDTLLATLGLRLDDRRPAKGKNDTEERREFFIEHSLETIDRLHDHPSVVAYTIFNEGWGQFDSDRIYKLLKARDPSRLYDSTSGWFRQTESDFDSLHVYFRTVKLKPGVRPMLLSECGGFSLNLSSAKHIYGYGACSTPEELSERIASLYKRMVIPAIKDGLCGCIYTQLSDIEDEINGLYSYDRSKLKVIPERIKEISEEIYSALDDACGE